MRRPPLPSLSSTIWMCLSNPSKSLGNCHNTTVHIETQSLTTRITTTKSRRIRKEGGKHEMRYNNDTRVAL